LSAKKQFSPNSGVKPLTDLINAILYTGYYLVVIIYLLLPSTMPVLLCSGLAIISHIQFDDSC
jgi:hypothetical protein